MAVCGARAHGSQQQLAPLHDGRPAKRRLGGGESGMRGVRCAFLVLPEKGAGGAATTTRH